MTRQLFVILFLMAGTIATKAQKADTIAIENVNVITMLTEEILEHQRVIIAGGKVFRIEPVSKPLTNTITRSIDGNNRYLIPGLSEMHYHLRSNDIQSDFKLLIANGITTARNMAEWPGQDHISIRNKVRAGELTGPNYFTTGPYLRSPDLANKEAVASMVKQHKEKGYDFLKIADNLPRDIYLKLLAECQANNLPVLGHSQRELPLEYSLRMHSIEHIEEFLYIKDANTGRSFFKLQDPALEKVTTTIKASGIYIGTTLSVFDFINNCLDDKTFAAYQKDSLGKYLASKERDAFLSEKNDYRKLKDKEFDGMKAKDFFKANFEWMKAFTKNLSQHEVKLLTGSDTYGMVIVGFSIHKEFELLQESGLKPYDILLASTVNPARYLGTYPTEGTIEEGKNANFIMLDKNPLEDIRNTRSIRGVMLKGKWLDRAALDNFLKEVENAYK
ncbi:amidohydrolase family protein [Flavihumibacter rivuli]|uniref:amidohydrolase family protein n=1 Tax=Flavihumibacter rivuli TaxID=2838156 RepID=UPI001BDDF790|nr:amidohydrolase family protein [Flavihumibacter rivuli]ULQ57088.1 amidohydrolase family protein [Flavihumibacter rivuli]